jgi:hypothetical protein
MDKRGPKPTWTLKLCLQSAIQHQNKRDWREADPNAYHAAVVHDFLAQCVQHMPVHLPSAKFVYTLEFCLESALGYRERTSWSKRAKGAYQAASRRGWIELCCAHMIEPNNKGGRPRKSSVQSVVGGEQYNLNVPE